MSWFASLRTIVYARRAVLALERIALGIDKQTQIMQLRYEKDFPARRRVTTVFDSLDEKTLAEEYDKRMRGEYVEPE